MAAKRKNRKGRPLKPDIGRVVQKEDKIRDWAGINTRFGLVSPGGREPAPRLAITPERAISRRDVEDRLLRAMKTIRAMPDTEKRFFIVGNSMPGYIQEYMDAYNTASDWVPRFIPTPFDVSDCLIALSWARHLRRNDWKIVWWRSTDCSFGQIAHFIGRSDETARRRYRDVITDVWCAANNVAARGAA